MYSFVEIPKHIAIIMDGNGRWAKKRGHTRVFGHIRGAKRVEAIVESAAELGVKALTLYAFSTENWSRPESERSVLWRLMEKFLLRFVDRLDENNIQLDVIGEIDRLNPRLRKVIDTVVDRLNNNKGLKLRLAISYGGRKEILSAASNFASDCVSGKASFENLSEEQFSKYLWTNNLGDFANVDLLIRTSGESRISNFLLWQLAYAEFIFTDTYWPDFTPNELKRCIRDFNRRNRRFGGIESEQSKLPEMMGLYSLESSEKSEWIHGN